MKSKPIHQIVFDTLHHGIVSGRYPAGSRLPSEAALVRQFETSRITVGRALRDLQQQGWIERRAGSGSFVRATAADESLAFGLLIPELGRTEIFQPICDGMAASRQALPYTLLWGNSQQGTEEQAWQLCRQFIANRVNGVFFAPIEWGPARDQINQRILAALDAESIPVVLLDRDAVPYPGRGAWDLVGIDNRRAGYLIAEHLLRLGARFLRFLARPGSAPTVEARIAGVREAMFAAGLPVDSKLTQRLDPKDANAVRHMLREAGAAKPDAIICANDRTAGELLQTLSTIGVRVPADIRVCGMDDVDYAPLLAVPLTTIRQPCRDIGEAAISAMLERVARPHLPPREILLDCKLVVRSSCGANTA